MSFYIPLKLASVVFALPFMDKPRFLADRISESPDEGQLDPTLVFSEVRDGYPKWAHLCCPKCNEHIQLPLAGKQRWKLKIDILRRPTLSPSIWETRGCGAHFFIRKGEVVWCD